MRIWLQCLGFWGFVVIKSHSNGTQIVIYMTPAIWLELNGGDIQSVVTADLSIMESSMEVYMFVLKLHDHTHFSTELYF